ncbi:hypothetical protein AVEN_12418-1, partial [Araneus ventricosus]
MKISIIHEDIKTEFFDDYNTFVFFLVFEVYKLNRRKVISVDGNSPGSLQILNVTFKEDRKSLSNALRSDNSFNAALKAGETVIARQFEIRFPDKQTELDLPALCVDEGKGGSPLSQISGVKRPLCHTNSLTQLPKYGVETDNEMELGK